MGAIVGTALSRIVGPIVGDAVVGALLSRMVGDTVGLGVGMSLSLMVGDTVGLLVGSAVVGAMVVKTLKPSNGMTNTH